MSDNASHSCFCRTGWPQSDRPFLDFCPAPFVSVSPRCFISLSWLWDCPAPVPVAHPKNGDRAQTTFWFEFSGANGPAESCNYDLHLIKFWCSGCSNFRVVGRCCKMYITEPPRFYLLHRVMLWGGKNHQMTYVKVCMHRVLQTHFLGVLIYMHDLFFLCIY